MTTSGLLWIENRKKSIEKWLIQHLKQNNVVLLFSPFFITSHHKNVNYVFFLLMLNIFRSMLLKTMFLKEFLVINDTNTNMSHSWTNVNQFLFLWIFNKVKQTQGRFQNKINMWIKEKIKNTTVLHQLLCNSHSLSGFLDETHSDTSEVGVAITGSVGVAYKPSVKLVGSWFCWIQKNLRHLRVVTFNLRRCGDKLDSSPWDTTN